MDLDKVIAGFVFTCLFLVLLVVGAYTFSTKTHRGYYLNYGQSGYQIWVNWENAPDEVAYKTYNGEEALQVYGMLQGYHNATNPRN